MELINKIYDISILSLSLGLIVAFILYIRAIVTKNIYIKASLNRENGYYNNTYINLYDYRNTKEILPRAINIGEGTDEFRINRRFIVSVDESTKVRYKYH